MMELPTCPEARRGDIVILHSTGEPIGWLHLIESNGGVVVHNEMNDPRCWVGYYWIDEVDFIAHPMERGWTR